MGARDITPEKLKGRHYSDVVERMQILNMTYRVVRQRGLITADYDPQRYTLEIDEEGIITGACLG